MDEIPRRLPGRTGKHVCTRCLQPTPGEEYFRYDHLCAECAADRGLPLASTPSPRPRNPDRGEPASSAGPVANGEESSDGAR